MNRSFSPWGRKTMFFLRRSATSTMFSATALLALASVPALPGEVARSASDVTVAACGDVMMQNVDGGQRPLSDDDVQTFMLPMSPWFRSSDVGFVNLEGPVGGTTPKRCNSNACHRFQQGPTTPMALARTGVTAVGIANNHANDMGPTGMMATERSLNEAGLHWSGHLNRPWPTWWVHGVPITLLSFTANTFAPDFRQTSTLDDIRRAKASGGLVVVAAHMGCEGASCALLQGGTEIFLGENRGDPVAFARAAVDAGADLVLGSGPHVPRAMEVYHRRLVAYSLGNCAVGPGIATHGLAGTAPVLRATLRPDGTLSAWDVGSFVNVNQRRVVDDPSQRALTWMLEATRRNFGPSALDALVALRQPFLPSARPATPNGLAP